MNKETIQSVIVDLKTNGWDKLPLARKVIMPLSLLTDRGAGVYVEVINFARSWILIESLAKKINKMALQKCLKELINLDKLYFSTFIKGNIKSGCIKVLSSFL